MAGAPEDLQYTVDHIWVRPGNGDEVRVGLTAEGLSGIAEILDVTLPEVGEQLARGDVAAEIDTGDEPVDVETPVSGVVVAVNQVVADSAQTLAADPYGDGWLMSVELTAPSELDDLLDADAYDALTDSS
ncbi:glycine cleavage system protein H [Acidipropionibacterium jensenii]|uniref:Glycine cleavage system H protein n=1 Tax=Acidipropionibacterium jensenii TaxID=1749 RepID=A0A448NVQ8_9ACTN|nr:glycine cleavage system protein H [Acidipropionibacterium jensenii]AZZ42211.1 glycine cleavage system protein H [Acidipropionibacterium jensenii]MDN5976466.1 glycine cleavage system protein H [Acidipropionibacterium jensenii]MDN5996428.1 glycine cleavage system protein H [Acidipropionibacterium jensenii]MDN6425767.1 glycine cleavage system protein H [Acidipropionibacterium jensenii]MDN6441545.1 glycine cleavage system protein H [Acidipropionibacterium jensenii]